MSSTLKSPSMEDLTFSNDNIDSSVLLISDESKSKHKAKTKKKQQQRSEDDDSELALLSHSIDDDYGMENLSGADSRSGAFKHKPYNHKFKKHPKMTLNTVDEVSENDQGTKQKGEFKIPKSKRIINSSEDEDEEYTFGQETRRLTLPQNTRLEPKLISRSDLKQKRKTIAPTDKPKKRKKVDSSEEFVISDESLDDIDQSATLKTVSPFK